MSMDCQKVKLLRKFKFAEVVYLIRGLYSPHLHRHSCSYERFKSVQGIDVPFCYGFYNFDPPVGPSLIGVVLEDLTSIGKDLHTYTERLTDVQPSHKEQMKYIDHIVSDTGPI